MTVPEGWREIAPSTPFNSLVGLRIAAKHTNSRGVCHGGVLATLADLALGYAMQAAKVGDWIESAVQIQRIGSRLAFANGAKEP